MVAALKGVPQQEIDAHKKNQDGCWRCGRTGHKTFKCFSFQRVQGTAQPAAPWKAAAVGESLAPAPLPKRPRENDDPTQEPTAKNQKIAAVETMDTEASFLQWEDSESDF